MKQIKEFIEKAKSDSELMAKFDAPSAKNAEINEVVTLAAEYGFTFTADDWKAYLDWSKSINGGKQSKEIPPEELENVSGGYENGSPHYPFVGKCWFHAASEAENRNGRMRKRCNQFACNALLTVNGNFEWHCCGCWGTDKCVGNWHYAEGCLS